jgi:nucleotide-binding universal stress UspA family protein
MATDTKLLVPLDGSKLAEHALAYVPVLMPLGITHVEIVSALDEDAAHGIGGRDTAERLRNLLGAYHEKLVADLRLQTGLEVTSRTLAGPAAVAIIDYCAASKPRYVVIATHGASGLTRWRVGSVAARVIRAVDCATLVVGPKAVEKEAYLEERVLPRFKAVLVPLDGSPLAEQALPVASNFVAAFGARLHLVGVASVDAMGLDAAWAGVSPQLEAGLAQETGRYLERIAAETPRLGSPALAVRFGSPAQALSQYVTDNAIDLVVMTAHGRGGFLRDTLGSTTDRMLGGDAPVLVVRSRL